MGEHLIAQASITINAPADRVWNALTNPEIIRQYMFGTSVISDWKVGSQIVWKGVWEGKEYEDKGRILRSEKEKLLQYSHFSPLSGKPDRPENYHTVTIRLAADGDRTFVELSQDNNETDEARKHSEKNWQMMLEGLKGVLESR